MFKKKPKPEPVVQPEPEALERTEEVQHPAVEAAKALLEKVGVLTEAARKVAFEDQSDDALIAMDDAVSAIVGERERELAASHLEALANEVYTGQAVGALLNAAVDLRCGRHVVEMPSGLEE